MVFAGLVSLTSSPYSSELFVLGEWGVWSASRVLLCVCVCVCVGLVHLVLYGIENKCVKCRK